MNIYQVIIKPVLTEKATGLTQSNVYTFEIHEKANKHQVAEVLQNMYKIKIDSVRILKRKGKTRRAGKKMNDIKLPDTKIAYVHVKEGKIDLFPQA